MPKNQVSVEELRCRVLKLKNSAYFDQVPLYEGSDLKRGIYILVSSSWFRGN